VDNVINPGPFVGGKLFVKVYSLASWNDRVDWRTPRPPEEGWNENRDFRTLEVSDAYPKHPSPAATVIDMAVDDGSLSATANRDGSFNTVIVIRNQGAAPSPEFGVHFYAGDPEHKGRLLAPHAAGPIMPGGTWSERSPALVLTPDEDTIVVVIDPDNKVKESDESNNKATHVIPGRKTSRPPQATSGRQRYFVTTVVGADQMTFQGQPVSWEQLPALLEKVPNRPQTVFQIAPASQDIENRSDWAEIDGRLDSLAWRYGFEYPSFIGVHPLGTKGGPPQTIPSKGPAQ
jgi:hypothetical protein